MNPDSYGSIRTSTKGLIFFATPHYGGTGPSIAAPVANIFSLLTDQARNELLPKLIRDPFFNRELTENFNTQKDDYEVRTFCETESSNIRVKSWKIVVPQYSSMLVVDHYSATYGSSRNGYPIPICDDHSGICKLFALNQSRLSTVKSNIEEVVRTILEQNKPTSLGPSTQALPPANPRYGTNAPRSLAIEEGSTSHVTERGKRAFKQDSPLAKNLVPQIKTSHFIGRDSVLSELEEYFDSSGEERRRAVIWGMAGVGKSQFSLEFCRRRHQNGYSMFWIEARSLESLTHSYHYIAKQLQLDCIDPVTSVSKWLRKASRSLVVFDNVDSLQIIEDFIPSDTVDVIITTRDSALVGSEMFPYGISVLLLDENDAIALFILGLSAWSPADTAAIRNNPSGILGSGKVSEVLSEKFGLISVSELQQIFALTDKLPLAIVQCASYLRQYPMPFSHYLEKFRAKAPESLRRFYSHSIKGAAYQESVMTTWDISIDKLTPDAVKMITFFGLLDHTQIMMPFLEHALDDCQFWGGRVHIPLPDHLRQFFAFLDTQGEFYECIGILDSLSLVKRDASKHQIYIHPMIHEYIHLRLPVNEAVLWLQRVTALLHHYLPPLLYSSYLDKNAAQQSEQVFLHLGRNSDLVELYQTRFSQENANDSAAFFLEAHLWYRGSRYLDLAERLITASGHPWDAEMIYGSKLLDDTLGKLGLDSFTAVGLANQLRSQLEENAPQGSALALSALAEQFLLPDYNLGNLLQANISDPDPAE
ncbi:kinesin [Metarhizium guizhouense ARSEF 977]|uniref:Kinesin n=1 Tax=Metarhizium guizhouense (strain ARSEF 977) TaxID=1276136 RepID=A0A0B4GUZ3_METGA|nr:kinesin [Metarhizium guizhouense ARSEF 977]